MTDKRDWLSVEFWAKELEKKYPKTNLFSLSDEKLGQMLLSLDNAKGMPSLPDDSSYYTALISEWSVVQCGYNDFGEVPDAIV